MEREESLKGRWEDIFKRQEFKKQLLDIAGSYPDQKALHMSFSELEKHDPDLADRVKEDPDGAGTVLHLACHDQPGLLSRVAAAIVQQGLQVHSARIATFGEKVEDTFLVSDQDHQPLTQEAMDGLDERIKEYLE